MFVFEKLYIWLRNYTRMENNCLPSLVSIGQKYVEDWLYENEYTNICKELLHPNDYGFSAEGKRESLLVQVRTFLHPEKPLIITDPESDNLTSKAAGRGLIAYVAYAVVDHEHKLVGEIYWDRLSKFY